MTTSVTCERNGHWGTRLPHGREHHRLRRASRASRRRARARSGESPSARLALRGHVSNTQGQEAAERSLRPPGLPLSLGSRDGRTQSVPIIPLTWSPRPGTPARRACPSPRALAGLTPGPGPRPLHTREPPDTHAAARAHRATLLTGEVVAGAGGAQATAPRRPGSLYEPCVFPARLPAAPTRF